MKKLFFLLTMALGMQVAAWASGNPVTSTGDINFVKSYVCGRCMYSHFPTVNIMLYSKKGGYYREDESGCGGEGSLSDGYMLDLYIRPLNWYDLRGEYSFSAGNIHYVFFYTPEQWYGDVTDNTQGSVTITLNDNGNLAYNLSYDLTINGINYSGTVSGLSDEQFDLRDLYGQISGNTFTLYYDNMKDSRSGDVTTDWHSATWTNKIKSVRTIVIDESLQGVPFADMNNWFEGFQAATSIQNLDYLNTRYVTDMSYMFSNCKALSTIDISKFNIVNLKNSSSMFAGCSALSSILCLDDWSGKAGIQSAYMFDGCTNLTGGMGTAYNSSKTNIAYAHLDKGSSNPGYFSSPTTTVFGTLDASTNTLTVRYGSPEYYPNSVDDWHSSGLLNTVTKIVIDPSMQDAALNSMKEMFYSFMHVTEIQGMENLNTENVVDMESMFSNCLALASIDLSHFNTSNVTNMSMMFAFCKAVTSLDITTFDMSNVTDVSGMFYFCPELTTIYCNEDLSSRTDITSSDMMFSVSKKIVGGNGTAWSSSMVNKSYARPDKAGQPGYFTSTAVDKQIITSVELQGFDNSSIQAGVEWTQELEDAIVSTAVPVDANVPYKNWGGELLRIFYDPDQGSEDYEKVEFGTVLTAGRYMFSIVLKIVGEDFESYTFPAHSIIMATVDGQEWWALYPQLYGNLGCYVWIISPEFEVIEEGIDQIQNDRVQSIKYIREGQLLIERNGRKYNAQGAEMK